MRGKVSYPLTLEQRFAWNTWNNTGNLRTSLGEVLQKHPREIYKVEHLWEAGRRCLKVYCGNSRMWNHGITQSWVLENPLRPSGQPTAQHCQGHHYPMSPRATSRATWNAGRDQSQNYWEQWKGWIWIALPP